ncbi:MAG: CheR family methyltransferase, partial [Rhodanobacteraceae bacterium]
MNDKTDHDTGVAHNPDTHKRSHLPFPVVGLGASAGGLSALKRIFENLPKQNGMAFVVVLHLSPEHESSADKVLQACTRMPVLQVDDTTPLEPDHVYVISPAHDLKMSDGSLLVTPAERPRGRPVAIDLFFRTLADTHQEKAIGIVLSGTGTDGSVGIARIKEQGGVTFAQSPQDAEYEDMPRSAVASAQIDFVLPAPEIAAKLVALRDNTRSIRLPKVAPDGAPPAKASPDDSDAAEQALREVLEILATRSGHDFRCYKRATVLRRIERRMQVNLVKDVPAYRDFLAAHAEETHALLDDMLIGVTNFFRDRASFEALEREAIPQLFEATCAPEQVRAWVPGCATGEEAYSIAMLLADHAGTLGRPAPWQVFASDIDESAIASGRAGIYPESIVTDVPPTRLRQFFGKDGNRYRIHKAIRERVLFALHNVLRDPPFSQLNLVSCRNLMIYLDREIQARLLETFHFALRPGGLLFLGTSESADVAPSHFEVVDKAHRIFRARVLARGVRTIPRLTPRREGPVRPAPPPRPRDRRGFSFADVHQRVLEFYAPPSVVVDRDGNIVHMSEHAGRYLRFGAGEPTHNLVAVADPALRTEVRTTLFQAVHGNRSVETRVRIAADDQPARFVNIVVRPFRDPEADAEFVLVLFDEVEDALASAVEPKAESGEGNDVVRQLEAELLQTQTHLQSTIEQYETSNEELKASNEELQASNEELRSATEELETSKEELQSINEELSTVNFELKSRVDELAKANDDLQNFIGAADIAILFVDAGLRIKRFTPRTADLFNILPGDVGRTLTDITSKLDYPELGEDAAAVFDSLRPIEREVRSAAGRRYAARVLPYRTAENRIAGAALSFIDITHLRRAEHKLRLSEEHLQQAMLAVRDLAVIVLDADMRVTAWNVGAEMLLGWSEQEMLGESLARLYTPEDISARVPQHDLAQAEVGGHVEVGHWYVTRHGQRIFGTGVLSRIDSDDLHGYVKIVRATTPEGASLSQRTDRLGRESAGAVKDDFLAVVSHELKNPLNLISVNTDVLERLPETRHSTGVAAALEMIRHAIRGQVKIIDDLLDMSRIRSGKLLLNGEAVDLGVVVRNICDTAQADVARAGLQLTCELADQP